MQALSEVICKSYANYENMNIYSIRKRYEIKYYETYAQT